MHVVIESQEPIPPASIKVYIFDHHHDAVEFTEEDRAHRGSYFVSHTRVNPGVSDG